MRPHDRNDGDNGHDDPYYSKHNRLDQKLFETSHAALHIITHEDTKEPPGLASGDSLDSFLSSVSYHKEQGEKQ